MNIDDTISLKEVLEVLKRVVAFYECYHFSILDKYIKPIYDKYINLIYCTTFKEHPNG